ncbi:uncharacterized protein LOC142177353 [Nicotiana tabacum]|uniref:Uncharacterized protein LOC142177353 n=1 Tax=Nicotiana tabacum TaxID=4097 RepID=A0AC58TXJ5_TOBAC
MKVDMSKADLDQDSVRAAAASGMCGKITGSGCGQGIGAEAMSRCAKAGRNASLGHESAGQVKNGTCNAHGNAVLIRHVLLALNVHTLAAVHPTKGTIATIERYLARFFWSGQETSDRYHWSAWSKLCFPYEEGGANFRKLEDVCKAFTAKQWWRFRTTNSLWSQFVKAKYCRIYHPLISQWTAGKSHNWQAMCKLKYEVEQNILWRVGRGNSSFWYENWTNFGPLSSNLGEDVGYDNTKVNEVYKDGVWDWSCLHTQPPEAVKTWVASVHITIGQEEDDTPISTITTSGKFSVASAWNALRRRKDLAPFDSKLWHKDVPFKMSFLAWRAIHGKIATDERITRFGISLASKCCCCPSPGMIPDEEMCEHLFCQGHFAQQVWAIFAGMVGIAHINIPLRTLFANCWNHKSKNSVAAFVFQIMPPIVVWELWRSRCCSKYEMERLSVARSKCLITFNIAQLVNSHFGKLTVNNNWEDICKFFDYSLVERCITEVKWLKPHLLNSDGSCVNGNYGCGGVVRDNGGKMLMAYAIPMGQGTSNLAEVEALLFGLKWYVQQGYGLIIGETDSLLLHNCIQGIWSKPWRINSVVMEVKMLVEQKGLIIRHCFREANQVVDKMASLSHQLEEVYIFTYFDTLPRQVKGLLNVDRWQIPAFRVKKRRPSTIVYEPP